MKTTALLLLSVLAAASIQDGVKEIAKDHFETNMPKIKEEDTEIVQYQPAKIAYRSFVLSKVHFPKIIPSLKILVPVQLADNDYKQIEKDGLSCNKEVIAKTYQKEGNFITEEGFSVGEVRIWFGCQTDPEKLEVLIFGNEISGGYTKIKKIVEEEVCEEDPKTKEKVCHMEKKMKTFDREITEEVKGTVAKVIKSFFFKANLMNIK